MIFSRFQTPGKQVRKLAYAALCLAIALLLPFLTGHIPQIGGMLCPMHLPVLLCGLICGPFWGGAVGLVCPLLRHMLFAMPPLLTAITMTVELCAYGFFAGVFYRIARKALAKFPPITSMYAALVSAMVVGRLLWGMTSALLMLAGQTTFSLAMFWFSGFVYALPGIALQLILIPPIADRIKLP